MAYDRYTPRRASKRWLEGAPAYVLDVLDSKGPGERYTVLFTRPFVYVSNPDGSTSEAPGRYADTWIQFLGMSDAPTHPQGVSLWGEMPAHQAAAYRYRCKRQRIRWQDLPEHIRRHVAARAADEDETLAAKLDEADPESRLLASGMRQRLRDGCASPGDRVAAYAALEARGVPVIRPDVY